MVDCLEVDVSSEHTLLHTTMRGLKFASPSFLHKGLFQVRFQGQPGVDAGGLRRDFLARAGQVVGKAEHGFLMPAPGGQVQLHPVIEGIPGMNHSEMPPGWWGCLGALFAVAVLHEEPLGLDFVPSLCKQLLGGVACFEDLEAVRPDDYRALRSLRKLRIIACRAHPEAPGYLIIETSSPHGAKGGVDTIFVEGGSSLDGEHLVHDASWLYLNASELAIKWEDASSSLPPKPLILRRFVSDQVNSALEVIGYTVPSRTVIVRDALRLMREMSSPKHRRSIVGGGEEPEVTTKNFEKYINEATNKMLYLNVEAQLAALKEGFDRGLGRKLQDWPPERWPTLQRLLRGEPAIDLPTWRAATSVEGFPGRSEAVVDWWFSVLGRWEPRLQQAALTWSTGWAAMPGGGWPDDFCFLLHSSGQGPEFLPQAHTCSNTVDIPDYTSEEQLEAKLRQAIEERDFGFA